MHSTIFGLAALVWTVEVRAKKSQNNDVAIAPIEAEATQRPSVGSRQRAFFPESTEPVRTIGMVWSYNAMIFVLITFTFNLGCLQSRVHSKQQPVSQEIDIDELAEPDEIPDLPGSGVSADDLQTLMPDGSRDGMGDEDTQGAPESEDFVDPRKFDYAEGAKGIYQLSNGLIVAYPLRRILRGFGECVRGVRKHPAIDIAGLGPDAGLGTPIRAMVREKVLRIGRPEDDRKRYGRSDRRSGTVTRRRTELPRSKVIGGYGRVFFFTRNYGSSRTGTIIVTRGLSGPLKGHRIRYMHLGAVRPDLKPGSVLEPGEELGLMGGTAILDSLPHVHIDIETPDGLRVDVEKLFGIDRNHEPCG